MSTEADTSLRVARADYYAAAGLPPDGGIDDVWVKANIGPIPFAFPNSDSRRRLVPYHDLHHVVTGYETDLTGEAQVGAWEIGSGLRAATGVLLDLLVWGFMLVARPTLLFRAFVRGRRSRNLMSYALDERLLARTVGELRGELGLAATGDDATAADRVAFLAWSLLAVALAWGPLVPIAALVWWASGGASTG